MKEKLWPALPFMAAGGLLYLLFPENGIVWFIFGFSLVLPGIFINMGFGCRQSSRFRETLRVILLIQFGYLGIAGAQLCVSINRVSTSTGQPIDTIDRVKLIIIEDPHPIRGNSWMADARIVETASRHIITQARGRVTVFGTGKEVLIDGSIGPGKIVYSDGRFSSNINDSNLIWNSRNIKSVRKEFILLKWRQQILSRLNNRLMTASQDTWTFLSALVLGRRLDSGSRIIRNFRDAGCMHILALSGFHVGLIAAAIRCLTIKFLGVHTASLVSLATVLIYLMLVGLSPSLVRAVLMYGLWTLDSIRGRRSPTLDYLCLAFLVQAMLFPRHVFSLSFALSYAALSGILLGGLKLTAIFNRYMPKQIAAVLGVSLGAQAATMPLVSTAFGVWRPVSLIASVVLTPLISFTMAAGVLLGLLPKGVSTGWLSFILDNTVLLMTRISGWFATVPSVPIHAVAAWFFFTAGVIIPNLWKKNVRPIESRLPDLNPSPA